MAESPSASSHNFNCTDAKHPTRIRVLTVGDGDFSFSQAYLHYANEKELEVFMVASEISSDLDVEQHRNELTKLAKVVDISINLDATDLNNNDWLKGWLRKHPSSDGSIGFDEIWFNFPYDGSYDSGITNRNIRLQQRFLSAARSVLHPYGAVYISGFKDRGHYYDSSKLDVLGYVVQEVDFHKQWIDYGYKHRKGSDGMSHNLSNESGEGMFTNIYRPCAIVPETIANAGFPGLATAIYNHLCHIGYLVRRKSTTKIEQFCHDLHAKLTLETPFDIRKQEELLKLFERLKTDEFREGVDQRISDIKLITTNNSNIHLLNLREKRLELFEKLEHETADSANTIHSLVLHYYQYCLKYDWNFRFWKKQISSLEPQLRAYCEFGKVTSAKFIDYFNNNIKNRLCDLDTLYVDEDFLGYLYHQDPSLDEWKSDLLQFLRENHFLLDSTECPNLEQNLPLCNVWISPEDFTTFEEELQSHVPKFTHGSKLVEVLRSLNRYSIWYRLLLCNYCFCNNFQVSTEYYSTYIKDFLHFFDEKESSLLAYAILSNGQLSSVLGCGVKDPFKDNINKFQQVFNTVAEQLGISLSNLYKFYAFLKTDPIYPSIESLSVTPSK
ncbi:hypothetical protein P9112_001094 [Eukaryota sp. TZLM1-RC]